GEHAVEQAPVEGVFRGDHAPRRHEVDGAALPDEPGEPLRAPSSRQYTEGDLRQSDSPGAIGGDAEVCRHRDLEATANAVAVDRGNEELRCALHLVQDLL